MIIDMDSHLREGYFLDEVYKLDGPLAKFTPKKPARAARTRRASPIRSSPAMRRR